MSNGATGPGIVSSRGGPFGLRVLDLAIGRVVHLSADAATSRAISLSRRPSSAILGLRFTHSNSWVSRLKFLSWTSVKELTHSQVKLCLTRWNLRRVKFRLQTGCLFRLTPTTCKIQVIDIPSMNEFWSPCHNYYGCCGSARFYEGRTMAAFGRTSGRNKTFPR